MIETVRTTHRVLAGRIIAKVLAMAFVALLAMTACSGQGASASAQTQQGSGQSSHAASSSTTNNSSKNDISLATLVVPENCRATGFEVEPKVKVLYNGEPLARDKDYEVSYANNKKPGMASVTIKGVGDYEGTIEKGFKISGRYNPRILVFDKSRNSAIGVINFLKRCGCRAVFTNDPDTVVDISKYDGLAIPGGVNDVDPQLYGEVDQGVTKVLTWLDKADIKIINAFVKEDKPVLGICRGCQILNVALGGSLYQDIENGHDGTFPVSIKKGSWLYGLFGDSTLTFHGHHQSAKKLGKGFEATEWAHKNEFRIVEMIENIEHPIWGVQYHPEIMGKSGDAIGVRFRAECLKRI